MPIEINGKLFYTANETAKRLNISVGMLRYHRNEGNIEATDMGNSEYRYTEEQIAAANLEAKKRGPKPRNNDGASEEASRSHKVVCNITSMVA